MGVHMLGKVLSYDLKDFVSFLVLVYTHACPIRVVASGDFTKGQC